MRACWRHYVASCRGSTKRAHCDADSSQSIRLRVKTQLGAGLARAHGPVESSFFLVMKKYPAAGLDLTLLTEECLGQSSPAWPWPWPAEGHRTRKLGSGDVRWKRRRSSSAIRYPRGARPWVPCRGLDWLSLGSVSARAVPVPGSLTTPWAPRQSVPARAARF